MPAAVALCLLNKGWRHRNFPSTIRTSMIESAPQKTTPFFAAVDLGTARSRFASPLGNTPLQTRRFGAISSRFGPRFHEDCAEGIPLRRGERCNLAHEGQPNVEGLKGRIMPYASSDADTCELSCKGCLQSRAVYFDGYGRITRRRGMVRKKPSEFARAIGAVGIANGQIESLRFSRIDGERCRYCVPTDRFVGITRRESAMCFSRSVARQNGAAKLRRPGYQASRQRILESKTRGEGSDEFPRSDQTCLFSTLDARS